MWVKSRRSPSVEEEGTHARPPARSAGARVLSPTGRPLPAPTGGAARRARWLGFAESAPWPP
eukprot:1857438-Pyramimonas_sp.AAC.1